MSISDDGIPTGTVLPNGDALILEAGEFIDPLDPNGEVDGESLVIRSRFFLPQEPIEPIVFPALNPVIDDIQPRSGAPGTPVVIIGRNFTPFEGIVRFNGVISSYNCTSTTRVDTVVPNGATTGPVSVDGFNSPFDFTVLAPSTAPTIAGFSPTGGRPGDVVTISGTNLDRVTEARFNGVRADGLAPFSAQILQATVPFGATTGPISVSGPSGSATSAGVFVVGTGTPAITSFSPTAGGPGAPVDIFGTELGGANRVTFNGVDAQFSVISNTQVRAFVPGFVGSGPIRVHTPLGIAVSAANFFAGSPLPTITSFSPTSGRAGDIVTINGTNLDQATGVRIGAFRIGVISRSGSQQITFTVPSGAATGNIILESAAGEVVGGVFTVLPPAPIVTVSGIQPTQGIPGIGVFISGTGLDQVTAVTFTPGVAAQFGRTGDGRLATTVPTGATTGPITLTFPGGTVQTPVFTVITDTAPSVIVLSPTGGQTFNAGQVINVVWTAGDDGSIVSQDILFSANGGAAFQTLVPGLPGATRDLLVQLPNTPTLNGVIAVRATDNTGKTGEGRSGSFRVNGTVDARPTVRVTAPNGGETFRVGTPFTISWESADDTGLAKHDVRISYDGGANFQDVAIGIPGFRRNAMCTPTRPSDNAVVSVTATDLANQATEDRSDAPFRILPADMAPTVTVLTPNGGETFAIGQNVAVTWQAADDVAIASQEVRVSYDGGANWEAVAQGLAPADRRVVFPARLVTDQALVAVRVTDTAGQTTVDRSDAFFRVVSAPPTVRVIAPNGGETFQVGVPFTISWESTGDLAKHDVLISYDGGANWVDVVRGIPGFRRNAMCTPDRPSANALVQVIATDTSSRIGEDRSDAPFRILPADMAPTVTVLSPNGGEAFAVGQNVAVTWQAADDVGIASQEVRVSYDGGANWEAVAQGLAPADRRVVFPTRLVTDQALVAVRVTDTAQQTTVDRSDAFFRIVSAPPTVRVIAPNGGETFQVGQAFTISWESTGDLMKHDVLISYDGGANWEDVARGISGTRRNAVFTPTRASDNALVQVIATDTVGRIGEDRSDAPFRILSEARLTVRVLAPNGGEVFRVGEPLTISFEASIEAVAFDAGISYDGGANFIQVATNIPGFRRNVTFTPDRPSEMALAQVTARDALGQQATDRSDGFFRILPADQPPTVRVVSPNGGEVFAVGQMIPVSWTASDDVGILSQEVLISYDGGATWELVLRDVGPADRTASLLAARVTDQALVRVRVTDTARQSSQNTSDAPFRIRPADQPPMVRVVSPNGGETFTVGQAFPIGWISSDDQGIAFHDVRISYDGGLNFEDVVTRIPGFRQNAMCTPRIASETALIAVAAVDFLGQRTEDVSDQFFRILPPPADQPPTVTVLAPNGGESLIPGQTVTVSWTSADDRGLIRHDVRYSTDGGATYKPIAEGIGGSRRQAQWTVPNEPTGRGLVQVTATDTAGQTGMDVSDGFFTIIGLLDLPPRVTVLTPNGGEFLLAGQTVTVGWQSSDDRGLDSHDVEFSTDGGATWQPIALNIPGFRRNAQWTVPDQASDRALVRVTARDTARQETRDTSDAFFRILRFGNNTVVTVLSPNGGEQLQPGQRFTVSWQLEGDTPISQDVRFSADGGGTFSRVASALPGTARSVTWTVPAVNTAAGVIEVVTRDAGGMVTARDRSDAFFTVGAPPQASVTVLAPNGGERFTPGQVATISWKVSGDIGLTQQDVRVSLDGGATFPVIARVSGVVRNFAWVVPNQPTTQGLVAISFLDADGRLVQDASDGFFTIAALAMPPRVDSVFPNQGPVSGGTAITVRGHNFDARARVRVGGMDAITFGGTSTALNAITPRARFAGFVSVAVINPDGSSGVLENGFRYLLATAAEPATGQVVFQSAALAGLEADADAIDAAMLDAGARLLAAGDGEMETDISRPLGRSLLLPADAEPLPGLLPGDEVVARVVGPPEVIELLPGERVSLSLFAELYDAQGQPVRGRALDVVTGGKPANSTLVVQTKPVFSFAPFTALLATTLDTPPGEYLLRFAGQTLTAPFLLTPELRVPVRVLEPPKPFGPATAELEIGPATVTDPMAELGPVQPSAERGIVSLAAGATVSVPVTPILLDAEGGRLQDLVRLAADALPPGAMAATEPNPVLAFQAATLSVTLDAATPAGRYAIDLSGASVGVPGLEYGPAQLLLDVQPRIRRVQIGSQATEARVTAGQAAEYALTLSRTGYADGPVQLSAEGLPAGATAAFDPAAPTGNASTLRIATTAATPAGTYAVAIGGRTEVDGVEVTGTTVRLVVEAPAVTRTVKLAVTPTAVALRPGGTAKFAVKLNRTNATDVQVALRAAGNLPVGTVFAFTPTRTITSSSTLVVTLPVDAKPGACTFTVQGTTLVSGVTIEPSTPITVKVDPLA